MAKRKPVLYILTNNHFDPIWRRCWDRRMNFRGDQFASYAEIEDYYLTDNLDLARKHPEYKFEAESVVVARMFLRRHPRRLAELRALAQAGRFAVSGAGDNIVDTNMVLGESIVRNYLTGLLWVEDTLGVQTSWGVRNDGFGNSAQLPQIFRLCEIAHVTGMTYSPIRGEYWRGLDGSTVYCAMGLPTVAHGGGFRNYGPCKHSRGAGCRKCHNRGIDASLRSPLPTHIDEAALNRTGAGIVSLMSEEFLPDPAIIDWAKSQRDRYDVRFAIPADIQPFAQPGIDRVDDPPNCLLHDSLETNPNSSGCLVTRIKLKQTVRRQEYALFAAETLATLLATTKRSEDGAAIADTTYPRRQLADAWEKLLFTMFHDAVTATVVDPAYDELLDMQALIDESTASIAGAALKRLCRPAAKGVVSVLNTTGGQVAGVAEVEVPLTGPGAAVVDDQGRPCPVVSVQKLPKGKAKVAFLASVAPLSARQYRVSPGPAITLRKARKPVIENARFRVEADDNGITTIFDKSLNRAVSTRGQYRPNELILERDEGSPWATLDPNRPRSPLAGQTKLVSVETCPAFSRMTFRTAIWGFVANCGGFETASTVTLYRDLPRVDFAADVQWYTYNHRLRIAMPVPSLGRHLYGIPYGMIERRPYAPDFTCNGANGDWPAVNWAGIESGAMSVALLNRGLPSYCIEPDGREAQTILLSVLRSPAIPTCLNEPQYYNMTDFDCMRDGGNHHLEYALTAFDAPFADSGVVAAAEAYNAPLTAVAGAAILPAVPAVESNHVRISALKLAEKGDALIVRLWEFRGRGGIARLKLPAPFTTAHEVNLLERAAEPLVVHDGQADLPVRPWEILTVRMERA